MKTTPIKIATTAGYQTVDAHVFGAWAVHEALDYRIARDAGRWAITHVPTGCGVPHVVVSLLTKNEALKAAKAINAKFGHLSSAAIATKKVGEQIVELLWDAAKTGAKP